MLSIGKIVKVGGYIFSSKRAYISFFGSPSIPPNVNLGFDGVKNQTALDLIIYHTQKMDIGA